MIGKLNGIIDYFFDDSLILNVGGVGYHVFVSSKNLYSLGQVGDALSLFIETKVREDHIHLYGFPNYVEQLCYRTLLNVQGVGSKVALALLNMASPSELAMMIAAEDKSAISRAEGVGAKLAVRLITELKDKMHGFMDGAMPIHAIKVQDTKSSTAKTSITEKDPRKDAMDALVALGYGRAEAMTAIAKVDDLSGNVNDYIKNALKELGR
jgi:Holliday junction DNA helicase RuvA